MKLFLFDLGTETRIEVASGSVLGRSSQANIRLSLPDVSRRHCRVDLTDGVWTVTDLGSLNGTYVNNVPVEQAFLNHDDTLRVGGFTFTVELIDE